MNSDLMHSTSSGTCNHDARLSIEAQFLEYRSAVLPILGNFADSDLVTDNFNRLQTFNLTPAIQFNKKETYKIKRKTRISNESIILTSIQAARHNDSPFRTIGPGADTSPMGMEMGLDGQAF